MGSIGFFFFWLLFFTIAYYTVYSNNMSSWKIKLYIIFGKKRNIFITFCKFDTENSASMPICGAFDDKLELNLSTMFVLSE